MTTYPPQPPTRRLTRSRSNKMLGGVCAGLANYLNMDVTLVRILTVAISLFTGVPIIAYLVMLFVVPEEDVAPYVPPAPAPTPGPAPTDPVWGSQGAPWDPQGSTGPAPSDPAPSDPAPSDPAPSDPAPSDPAPNEADPTPETPLTESAPPQAEPGERSTWESTPADGTTKPDDKPDAKPESKSD